MSELTEKPLVSICVPAHNIEKYIKGTIECVINQTYQNWELIISEDCSTDSTLEIIRTFTDPRIIVIENKTNLGLVGNFNKVVKEAKGEFIKLLCGNDLISSTCIEKQVEVFLSGKYPNVSLVSSYTNLIDSEGKVLMTRKFPFKYGLVSSPKAIALNFLLGTNVIGEPQVGLVRRSVFSITGEYNASNSYTIDLDFWLQVLLLGDLYVIPEPLASFRISRESNTTKIKKNQAKFFRQFAKKIYDDEKFKITSFQYYSACFMSYIAQKLRISFMQLYVK